MSCQCPLLALSGHRLVRCTCLLLTQSGHGDCLSSSRYDALSLGSRDAMRRREFITIVGGAATWPLAAYAQQAAKAPVIGFLGASTASAGNQWAAAFVQRLRELGWIEGRTIAIEYRWTDGRNERVPEIAAEFVRLKVVS